MVAYKLGLTDQDKRFIALLNRGLRAKNISRMMNISIATVYVKKSRINKLITSQREKFTDRQNKLQSELHNLGYPDIAVVAGVEIVPSRALSISCEVPVDFVDRWRNCNCPEYDQCLDDAVDAIHPRRNLVPLDTMSWACHPSCPFRKVNS